MPGADVVALVARQPTLLQHSVETSLAPKLALLAAALGDDMPTARAIVLAAPRVLLASRDVILRLRRVARTSRVVVDAVRFGEREGERAAGVVGARVVVTIIGTPPPRLRISPTAVAARPSAPPPLPR